MMKNLEVYEDVFENGQLSVSKLSKLLDGYEQDAINVELEVRKTGAKGDALADDFFNALDEVALFSFETDTKHIDVSLGRFHDYDEEAAESEFGVSYLVEERNLELALENVDDYLIGQEVALIEALKTLGYQE